MSREHRERDRFGRTIRHNSHSNGDVDRTNGSRQIMGGNRYRKGGVNKKMEHGGYHRNGNSGNRTSPNIIRRTSRGRTNSIPRRQMNQSMVSNQTNVTFSFRASDEHSLISQMATSFDVDEITIRNKVEHYLQDIMSVGGDSSNVPMAWWNCSRCGDGGGLCLFGNCCNGSASGGEWEIDCTRPIGKPNRPK